MSKAHQSSGGNRPVPVTPNNGGGWPSKVPNGPSGGGRYNAPPKGK